MKYSIFKKSLLIYFPIILLITFSSINFFKAKYLKTTQWAFGGFGLHSTFDSFLFRNIEVYGVDKKNNIHIINKTTSKFNVVKANPTKSNAMDFIKQLLKQKPNIKYIYNQFQVEIWQYQYANNFNKKPKIEKELVVRFQINIPNE